MKNKKSIIIGILFIIFIIAIGIFIYSKKNKTQDVEEKKNEEIQEDNRKPDITIYGTEENKIELNGFEVTKIDLFKTTDLLLETKANIVNNTDETVNGFFIEIDLFDKNGKKVTTIAENHEEEIKPGETYVLESAIINEKKSMDIVSAKIISLEKETKTTLQESFEEVEEAN